MNFTAAYFEKEGIELNDIDSGAKFPRFERDPTNVYSFPKVTPPTLKISKEKIPLEKGTLSVINYPKLTSLGFKIVKKEIRGEFGETRKRVVYSIKKENEGITSGEKEVEIAPPRHRIELNSVGAVRIMGPNSINNFSPQGTMGWISTLPLVLPAKKKKTIRTTNQLFAKAFKDEAFLNESDKFSFIRIKHIPVMERADGAIVCIKEMEEGWSILITGQTGCLAGNTELLIKVKKELRKIQIKDLDKLSKEIEEGEVEIESLNKEGKLNWRKITNFYKKGKKKIKRVWLPSDLFVDATDNHLFLYYDKGGGLKEAPLSEFKERDLIPRKKRNKEIGWYKIRKIEELKETEVYDISVDKDKTFCLYNGIIVHNSGKSVLLHRILDCVWHYKKSPCLHLSDSTGETFTFVEPMEDKEFVKDLKKLNEIPRRLPAIFLFPTMDNQELFPEKIPAIEIPIPLKSFIDNWDTLFGAKPSATASEIKNNRHKFLEVLERGGSEEEIHNGIMEVIKEICGDSSQRSMKNKMIREFGLIFQSKTCEVSTKDKTGDLGYVSTKIKLKINKQEIIEKTLEGEENKELNIFHALLNLKNKKPIGVPILITKELLGTKWGQTKSGAFSPDTTFIADTLISIIKTQNKIPKKERALVFIFIDEIQGWCSNKDSNPAKTIMTELFSKGRHKGICLVVSTQNYGRVDKNMRDKVSYCFTMRQKSNEEAKSIALDFHLGKKDKDAILDLNKGELECLGTTTLDDGFAVVYPNGITRYTDEPQRGKLLKPLSKHTHYKKEQKE